jgi:hypothetical protein
MSYGQFFAPQFLYHFQASEAVQGFLPSQDSPDLAC